MPIGNPLGYSFAPTFENADIGRRGGSPAETPQGALKTLNFRLPRIAGAATSNAISPLVSDERRGSPIAEAVLQSVMRTVLGPEQAAAFTMAPPVSSGPVQQQGRDPGSSLFSQLGARPSPGGSPGIGPPQPPPPRAPYPGVRPGDTAPAPAPPGSGFTPPPPPPPRVNIPDFGEMDPLGSGIGYRKGRALTPLG